MGDDDYTVELVTRGRCPECGSHSPLHGETVYSMVVSGELTPRFNKAFANLWEYADDDDTDLDYGLYELNWEKASEVKHKLITAMGRMQSIAEAEARYAIARMIMAADEHPEAMFRVF